MPITSYSNIVAKKITFKFYTRIRTIHATEITASKIIADNIVCEKIEAITIVVKELDVDVVDTCFLFANYINRGQTITAHVEARIGGNQFRINSRKEKKRI